MRGPLARRRRGIDRRRMVAEAAATRDWLKLFWGSGRSLYQPLPRDHVTFAQGGRPGIATGDRLVILGVGTSGKLLAIVTATSGIAMPGPDPQAPHRCESRIDLVCAHVDRAPACGVLPGADQLRQWLETPADHRAITEAQVAAAEAAILAAGGTPPAA